ncbi:maleylpyruvate isomerase family mycothiol-dependent enzyme [Sinomonas halotolerans]|uniref:Maleylpyruvate isomerase family mycothiol-dependent enzyme n=1 Tax=Sinomonas halotolerans TaxID=1644133 RepID=A0ABU9WYK7_9MICC
MSRPWSEAGIPASEVISLDEAELGALLALLRSLDGPEWELPTDCTLWTVRDICAHAVGLTDLILHPARWAGDLLASRREYPTMSRLDALNQLHVDRRARRSGPDLVADFGALVPARLALRRRVPAWARWLPLPGGFSLPPGTLLGYLLDVILIRDLWMHRVDISTATGRPLALDGHDRAIVHRVMADLAVVWDGPPGVVRLAGPAGGAWTVGGTDARSADPRGTVECDAVEYMRCLAGRNDQPGLHLTGDPAVGGAALRARVPF